MGGGRHKDKKFIAKLIKQLDSGAKTLYIVNDKDGTPTYTYDFAKNVRLLIESNQEACLIWFVVDKRVEWKWQRNL